jgi:hypothetical protein
MAIGPKMPFSKRFGYHPPPKEITIWEEAPETLRYFVLKTAEDMDFGPQALRTTICAVLRVRPNEEYNWEVDDVRREASALVYGCDWFKFYDFLEKVRQGVVGKHSGQIAFKSGARGQDFDEAVNEFFIDEGIGWQLTNGELVTRGSETFESNVRGAVKALKAAGRMTAHDELLEALRDLSRRPDADLTGAIQHAMVALECVARDVCGDEGATLGAIIKRYPGIIPKPLDESVSKAWGFASEMARHIKEGRKPERREVELVVGIAATVATYLSR